MNKRGPSVIQGLILVLVGIFALLVQLEVIPISWFVIWPIFVIGVGLAFHAGAWAGGPRSAGLLVPGGTLTAYGLCFLACTLFGWKYAGTLWPIFILGPGIGLLELYLFGNRQRGLIIPIAVLLATGTVFLVAGILSNNYELVLPLGLIAGGLIVVGYAHVAPKLPPPRDYRPNNAEPTRYSPVRYAQTGYGSPVYPEPPKPVPPQEPPVEEPILEERPESPAAEKAPAAGKDDETPEA